LRLFLEQRKCRTFLPEWRSRGETYDSSRNQPADSAHCVDELPDHSGDDSRLDSGRRGGRGSGKARRDDLQSWYGAGRDHARRADRPCRSTRARTRLCRGQRPDKYSHPPVLDLSAWELGASARQHAVSVGVRARDRGHDGAGPVSGFLPHLRDRGLSGSDSVEPGIAGADGGCVRGDLRGDGGIPAAVSKCSREDVLLHHSGGRASVDRADLLVPVAALRGNRDVRTDGVGVFPRCRRLGSRRWICDRAFADQVLYFARSGGCTVTERLTSYTVARAPSVHHSDDFPVLSDSERSVRLIPRDEQFYELFTQLAERLSLAARLLHQLFREPERHSFHVQAIKTAEHEADEITREIIDRLDRTFITPFDREDIHELASALDEVVDLLDGAARRVEIFRITTVHQAAVRGMKDPKVVGLKAQELKKLEEEGDAIYHESMGALFDGALDAIEVIKWKELYDKVEDALDQAEDVANVLQSIALKNG